MQLRIHNSDDGREITGVSYNVISSSSKELLEVNKAKIADIFAEQEELKGADASVDDAVENPGLFVDYLKIDANENVSFDEDHERDELDDE